MTDEEEIIVGRERSISVSNTGDEIRARRAAESLAERIGFKESETADVGLAATELATNLLKHANDGTIIVQVVEMGSQSGIRLQTKDAGPGIPDTEATFSIGESSAESLGYGLTTVNQVMDTVEITTVARTDVGTHVVADRWLKPPYSKTTPCPYSIGATSKGMSSGQLNGDTFIIKNWNDKALVGVIDGLGHGPEANTAALQARDHVESHFDRLLASIFSGTERACKGTRGVVMGLVRFDWVEETATIANVGNIVIEASGPERSRFIVRRGVIGGNAPDPSVVTETWKPHYTMVLHSDGVSSQWTWEEIEELEARSADALSNWLLKHHGKPHDDATAAVVTEATDE